MRYFLFFLITTIQTSLSQDKYIFSPVSTQLAPASHSDKKIVKVGFIDSGTLLNNDTDFNGIKITEILPSSNSLDQKHSHGGFTIRTFAQSLPKTDSSRIEIIYCHTSDKEGFDLFHCLSHLQKENVDYINISLKIEELTEKEITALSSLTNNGTIIAVSAGNDRSRVGLNSLCGLRMKNKICVGGLISSNGKFNIAPASNYGQLVDTYSYFHFNIKYNNSSSVESGTSFSSPYFLSQLIQKRFKGENFDFKSHYKKIAKDNNYQYIPNKASRMIAEGGQL